ncbi:MAG: bifunctional dihydroneopterin aldolase/7,8-dihydroneopterin epimerase, partial [Chloroflexi bacterium]|nr:bifunctional dihydroneopterin aldolase/7,8-dihydroneopterin epimerase [Chloroflexota bacterium]
MTLKKISDKILIENLELFCIIGVNKWEKLTPQKITIDLEIETNLNASIKSDNIEHTV